MTKVATNEGRPHGAYLELAIRRQFPLASCDRELVAAATLHGIDILTA